MIVTVTFRLEEFPDSTHFATHSGKANECMSYLSGLLVGGVIVDRLVVMGR